MNQYIAFVFLALLSMTGTASWAQKCSGQEATLYEGTTGKKTALVCASPAKPPFSKIEYRFGNADKVDLSFVADSAGGKKFFAASEAYAPRASLSHLWFVNGDTTYVISECLGGMCPHQGGIVVAKGKKILARIKLKDGLFTADDVVDFGNEKSKTPLIQIKQPDAIDVTSLYDK